MMFKNYFKTAWRNLLRNKTFSIINIVGLAMGLACFLVIVLYVSDELSYDRFNENANRIYRINTDLHFGGGEMHIAETSDMMGQILKKDYPQVEQYTRIFNNGGAKLIRKNNSYVKEVNVANVDSTFFDVFTFPVVEGDTHNALNEPNTVVVTESTAKKYFGTTGAVGKTIAVAGIGRDEAYKITAVIKDMPQNSHFNFDFLFSMKDVNYKWGQFSSHNFHTYLLLEKGTNYRDVEKGFNGYIARYVLPEVRHLMRINSIDDFRQAGNELKYSLIPLTKIHLYSNYQYEFTPNGNIRYVYIFGLVALFILLIACVNFVNLTTARSANRAKEVGIRKVLGTARKRLILQFLTESVLMVYFSMMLAVLIVWGMLPFFNEMANKTISISDLFSPAVSIGLLLLPIVVGVIAGSYPAFFLSSFKPVEVLKGRLKKDNRSGGLRNVLVVFQFAISIFLIAGTIVIYKQLHFIQTTDIGFNKNQVLIVSDANRLNKREKIFRDNMLNVNGVQSATISSFLPVADSRRSAGTFFSEVTTDFKSGFSMEDWWADEGFIPTMGIQLIQGRNFSKDFLTDSSAVIINEAAAKILGRKELLNTKIYKQDGDSGILNAYHIIGVVKDFNFESLHQNIGPLSIRLGGYEGDYVSMRLNTTDIKNILKTAENNWKSLASSVPFNYRFLDDSFDNMYRAEQRVSKIAVIFSVLAIFIACLGLFGLAAFVAEQRTKEIGIRKVLGARADGIAGMLSKDFIKLVAIAFIIAVPIGWYSMHKWLQSFAFRIEISSWIFVVSGAIALLIALVTVSFQAIKAAIANPVKSLRTE